MTRRQRENVVALVLLGVFLVSVAWRGFDAAWNAAILLLVLVFGFGHTLYVAVVQWQAARRPVTLEPERLVQRNGRGRIVATIDRSTSFAAACVHQDSEWVLYKATQGRTVMWISVPSDGDGALVRALGLSWPPPTPSGLRYL
jgi:hypothetical protein